MYINSFVLFNPNIIGPKENLLSIDHKPQKHALIKLLNEIAY